MAFASRPLRLNPLAPLIVAIATLEPPDVGAIDTVAFVPELATVR